MRSNGRTARRLRKLAWRFSQPDWADNHGIMLPVKHTQVSPGIAREIYLGDYEAKEIEIISRRLAVDDIVFEVGAGLGFLSAYCAKRTGGERVFAYEANPELIPLIRETHARNGVAPTLINALLAKGEGEREFHLEDDFWASSAHRTGGRAITVKQLDLNSELARIKPGFLIVDIEGGEAEFFAGAELATVNKICVETHPDVLGDRVLSEMFAGLVAKGFALDFSLIRKNVFFFHRAA
ncbi:MAG: FkbM family methyltransferase [Burkholderiaceae bacterium]|nr:FkbM family methyltransferase [Sulfuritalea sp.]MCF8175096.1 FkbM family methyltransferase [Burkholderiaceae bacterium]